MIPGADMIHWKNWAPRLGFAWKSTGDGRTVLRGFARPLLGRTGLVRLVLPASGPRETRRCGSCIRGSSWFRRSPPRRLRSCSPQGVKNPYTDQYGLSFDQQLGTDYAVGVQAMYKHTDDMIGWQIEDDGVCEPFPGTIRGPRASSKRSRCAR